MSRIKKPRKTGNDKAVSDSSLLNLPELPPLIETARSGKCEHCGNELVTEFGGIYGDCRFCGWMRVLPVPDKFSPMPNDPS